MLRSFKAYYELTKPGIIRGNMITGSSGYLFASRGQINFKFFGLFLVGMSFVIAGGCVYNNFIDRGIDKKMVRTKNRALVTKTIVGWQALLYATILTLIGVYVLYYFTNILTVMIACFGLFAYVVLYGIAKRRTIHSTAIGSISGALPPVAGYCAVTNHLDIAALLFFLILVL